MLSVSSTTLAGDAWDTFGGAPDPFVQSVIGSETAPRQSSRVADDAFSVTYTTAPLASGARADQLQAYRVQLTG